MYKSGKTHLELPRVIKYWARKIREKVWDIIRKIVSLLTAY